MTRISKQEVSPQETRISDQPEALAQALMDNLYYVLGRIPRTATLNDWYLALAYTVRDRILHRWMSTIECYMSQKVKSVSYLSAEFLMGPQLGNNLLNLGIFAPVREAVHSLGLDLDELLRQEEEPGLGNGGLGRLAACILDSCASRQILAVGYGIRYEFGIFDQEIRDGWQVEVTDKWLRLGNPWEIHRPEISYPVNFGGHTSSERDSEGRLRVRWRPEHVVRGVAYDMPVAGYQVNTVNLLRLWKSEAPESFDFQAFNAGQYYRAVEQKMNAENISKVLYPNDESEQGRSLRLQQQYFFVSCSLQDMMRVHLSRGNGAESFHEFFAVQLNDTHPAIAVAELMRILLDEQSLAWDRAWQTTRLTMAYTNHTLLPEALEKWPLPLFAALLPRLLEIIYEINQRFLDEVRNSFSGDAHLIRRLSIIDETGSRYVRMANLACIGSHSVNGVAQLHSDLLKQDVLRDFHILFPGKLRNVTNGVTPRRFVALANPGLADLLRQTIGERWLVDMAGEIGKLETYAEQCAFRDSWRKIKLANKARLATLIQERAGVTVDPASLFDIQVKRIHEYKRQHLNALHVVTLYNRLKNNPHLDLPPRTVIFGGKAAPAYGMAKLIIKLINSIASVVNNDRSLDNRLKVVYLADFNVKNAQEVYPAADLSEQISTAGKEASGTGNMKFAMNGALTIGTLDGANIEMRESIGADNFFLFGLDAAAVQAKKAAGYAPRQYYESQEELRQALDMIGSGCFSRGDDQLFQPLINSLLLHDEYMLLADYRDYIDCQMRVAAAYRDPEQWARKSIINLARMGGFSSDRTVEEYARTIWQAPPVTVPDLNNHHAGVARG